MMGTPPFDTVLHQAGIVIRAVVTIAWKSVPLPSLLGSRTTGAGALSARGYGSTVTQRMAIVLQAEHTLALGVATIAWYSMHLPSLLGSRTTGASALSA